MDLADQVAVGGKDVHSVIAFAGPSGGGPDVAIYVAPDAIRGARRHVHKKAAILEAHAVFDIVDTNWDWISLMLWTSGIDDVEFFLVRRKTQTVGLIHVAGDHRRLVRLGVEAVDVGGQLEGSFVAFVVRHDSVAGIGEPDGAIRVHDDVVRRIEFFVLKTIDENSD